MLTRPTNDIKTSTNKANIKIKYQRYPWIIELLLKTVENENKSIKQIQKYIRQIRKRGNCDKKPQKNKN